MTNFDEDIINRFEVIDETGRLLVLNNVRIREVSIQDDSRTLKVFVNKNESTKADHFDIDSTIMVDKFHSLSDLEDLQRSTKTSYNQYLLDDLDIYGIDDEGNCFLLN